MYRLLAGIIGIVLLGSQAAFSEVAPVKYLAGKSESGQPHLYWFGAAAVESTLAYGDGVSDESVYVADPWDNNQALMRFGIDVPFFQLVELSALTFIEYPGDTAAHFALSARKDTGSIPPETFLFQDTVGLQRGIMDSGWVSIHPNIFLAGDTSFWGTLHWLEQERPTNPRIGEDRSGNSGRNYIGYGNSYFQWKDGGDRMIRAKVLVNNPASELADSFSVYRWTGSAAPVCIATTGGGQFDFLDSPPSSDDYYYYVSRWVGQEESPPSNLIGLAASPTVVKDRQTEKHVFLLSEPFPNPTSAGVLFTARADRQMQLGFSIYNLLGQKVFSKPVAGYSAGEHQFFWNGQDASGRRLPSGLYLLRFQAGEEVLVKKVTLLR